ncbi:SusC/RagA family TonB-linked outer membrane protein [Neolewinella litorea]|uniref:SusC/RagA family TonB-linked outer membrane protein n=1 Tax=Neolewinella litorea TaxID=2562452 RepID=A0A4S4NMQ3_9BACT|nr:SusC/RagA family TonB-linked outer membrane protein [Neolewinella litorea]THH41092.1 SusC/RagA family TonB-linked outer membrane protein [Neolewinella litorea]
MQRLSLVLVLVFGAFGVLLAQQKITGTITDDAGEPLIGASILVEGTTTGTVTDFDGTFALTVPDGGERLVVSYTGYASQTIPLTSSTAYQIILQEGVQLTDVVVTALGITRSEKSLGYAVTEVDGDDVTKTQENSVVSALSGRIPGAQINNSNSGLGGSANIILRGATSVTGSNKPLFVVDGIPIANDNNNGANAAVAAGGRDYGTTAQDINPADIASISVLKGGAAAALYGSRASNGVILITTKSGKARKGIGVTVNSGVTFNNVAVLPDFQDQYGGGYTQEFSTFEYDPDVHPAEWASFDGQFIPEYYADESWGPEMDGTLVRHWDSWYPGENFGELRPWSPNPDNVRDFYDTGVSFDNNVAIAGGNEQTLFRLSYTNSSNAGVYPESKLNRNTLNVNATQQLGSKFEATINGTYVNTRGEGRPAIGYGGFGNAINVQSNFNEWFQRQLDMDRLRDYKQPDGTPRTWNIRSPTNLDALYWESPYWVVYEDRGNDNRDRVYGNLSLKYEVMPGLSITGSARTDYYNFQVHDRLAARSAANIPYAERLDVTNRENNFELIGSYTANFSSEFSLDAQLGGNLRQDEYSSVRSKSSGGLSVPGIYTVETSVDRPERNDFQSQKEVQSVYGRLGLGWRAMLYVDLTARNDWSSALEAGNNSYFYPSISSSFVFSELLENSFISFGKIRAGFATVGNDPAPYQTRQTYGASNPYGSFPTFAVPNTQAKFDLVAESITTWEAGIDMRFFNDRLGFDVTYYDIQSRDLIIDLGVSGTSGFSNVTTNAGLLTNKGVEVQLYGTPIQTENFTWNARINFASNENQVVELAEGQDLLSLGSYGTQFVAQTGQPYGTLIGLGYERNDAGQKVVDEDGFPILASNLNFGSVFPDYTGGIINDFEIYKFRLGTVVDFRKGGVVYSVSNRWGTNSGLLASTVGKNANGVDVREPVSEGGGILVDGVTEDGQPNTTYVNAQDYFGGLRNFREEFTYDASFIKLREISLGYDLPGSWLENNFVANAAISVFARNVAILHKNTPNIDPETSVTNGNVQGFENGQNPSVRSIGMKLRLGF